MAVETLGEVQAPSGTVLIVDMGLLNVWCHDRPPVMPDGLLSSDEQTARANDAADYRIEGADAGRAAQLFDRWLFDIPRHGSAEYEASFAEVVRKNALDARLVTRDQRVTHLERARQAVAGGSGEFPVHGVQMVAVKTPALPLRVIGERRGSSPYPDCWSWIALDVAPGDVASVAPAGTVAVDKARLMFVDLEALGAWRHEEPTDGLADFVFWGRDAQAAAERFGVPKLDDGTFGFVDLPVMDAVKRGEEIEAARAELRIATDFRPHSHHYHLLKQMRGSRTESGTMELAGSTCCAFFTSWGDGFFPVFRELDERGALLRVRIDLGTPQAIANMDYVNGR